MTIDTGKRYILTNKKSGTVIDLNIGDNHVQCWSSHDGDNQRWDFTRVDGGWHIQNAQEETYLGFEGDPEDGRRIVCLPEPYIWHIWPDDRDANAYRFCVPNTTQNLDLDNGNRADGSILQLWSRWEGDHQAWYANEV